MIEQKEEARVPAKKMKQYGKKMSSGMKERSEEMPAKDFALKNEANGTLDYIPKQDELTSSDAKKIDRGFYKYNRYC